MKIFIFVGYQKEVTMLLPTMTFMEGVVTHDFRFRLEDPTKKEN